MTDSTDAPRTPPECDVDGCTEESDYLLVSGDLCERHAAEAEPGAVAFCRHVLGPREGSA